MQNYPNPNPNLNKPISHPVMPAPVTAAPLPRGTTMAAPAAPAATTTTTYTKTTDAALPRGSAMAAPATFSSNTADAAFPRPLPDSSFARPTATYQETTVVKATEAAPLPLNDRPRDEHFFQANRSDHIIAPEQRAGLTGDRAGLPLSEQPVHRFEDNSDRTLPAPGTTDPAHHRYDYQHEGERKTGNTTKIQHVGDVIAATAKSIGDKMKKKGAEDMGEDIRAKTDEMEAKRELKLARERRDEAEQALDEARIHHDTGIAHNVNAVSDELAAERDLREARAVQGKATVIDHVREKDGTDKIKVKDIDPNDGQVKEDAKVKGLKEQEQHFGKSQKDPHHRAHVHELR